MRKQGFTVSSTMRPSTNSESNGCLGAASSRTRAGGSPAEEVQSALMPPGSGGTEGKEDAGKRSSRHKWGLNGTDLLLHGPWGDSRRLRVLAV